MEDSDLAFSTVRQLRGLLDSRQVSPVEFTELYLRRIEALDPRLNAFITVSADVALAAARKAEEQISKGVDGGTLQGIPISLKDIELTKGIRTTYGSLVFRDAIPDKDSTNAARIRKAGAVILGKTNTPEIGLSGITKNRLRETCVNPWDTDYCSGGSSGGAAVAVAAGMCALASGSDTGGSIRMPASFCGVYGLKPTFGRVPRHTVLEYGDPSCNLSSQAGPMTHTVEDAAILLQVVAGHDPGDPYSLREDPPDFLASLSEGVQGLRVAWSPDLGYASVEPEVLAVTTGAAKIFEELGCQVDQPQVKIANPGPSWLPIIYAIFYASVGRLFEGREDELTDYGFQAMERGKNITGAEFARHLGELHVMRATMDDLFESYDLLVTPMMSVSPFRPESPPTGSANLGLPFSFGGNPSASIPCGFTSGGLPIGLQIAGRRGAETTVLRASAAFEQARPWAHLRPPVS